MIGLFPLGILGALSSLGAVPFVRCDQCTSINACNQTGRCGILDIQQRANEQMRAYWQSNDPNTFDLPPDAVREVRAPLLLGWDLAEGADSDGGPGAGFADSDGGECD